ncbi:MAG: TraB/GumN family protein [Novosphingobium sp.]
MRKMHRILLALGALATSLAATPPIAAPRAGPLATPPKALGAQLEVVPTGTPAHPAIWQVSDKDTTIFLFGTIHALPQGIDWFGDRVASAFNGSQELVTEIVEADPAALQASVRAKAMLPAGTTLRGMLTPAQRAKYDAALTTYGIPVAALDRFKPWYAAVFLSALPVLRDGYAAQNGVEELLNTRAKAAHRPHSALETAQYQLGLFDSLPLATQMRYLNEVVTDLPTARNQLGAMVEAWKRGDADTLARLMNEDQDEPELMERLVTNRNKTWADWIKARLDKPGVVFVAVGAGHLAGAGSVQDQLRTRGITASRVQ